MLLEDYCLVIHSGYLYALNAVCDIMCTITYFHHHKRAGQTTQLGQNIFIIV